MNEDLSPATVRLLEQMLASAPKPPAPQPLTSAQIVRYLCGALDAKAVAAVEEILSTRDADRERLVRAHMAVSGFRQRPLSEIRTVSLSGGDLAEFAALYLEVAAHPAESMKEGFVSLLSRGADGARAAYASLVATLNASAAVPRLAGIHRSGASSVTLEGPGRIEVTSADDEIQIRFPDHVGGDDRCYASLDTALGRLRICDSEIREGVAYLPLDTYLTGSGPIVVRLGDWPSRDISVPVVCFIGDQPTSPFASCSGPGSVEHGVLTLNFEWNPAATLKGPGTVSTFYGTGGSQWQLLGEQEVSEPVGNLRLSFEYPASDQLFYWPIKLIWHPKP